MKEKKRSSREFWMLDHRFHKYAGDMITIRTDLKTILVDSEESYDGKKIVKLLKKIEISSGDEKWKPYPSVFLVSRDNHPQTICFVRGDEITVLSSPKGIPDEKLMSNAQKAGIYTETID